MPLDNNFCFLPATIMSIFCDNCSIFRFLRASSCSSNTLKTLKDKIYTIYMLLAEEFITMVKVCVFTFVHILLFLLFPLQKAYHTSLVIQQVHKYFSPQVRLLPPTSAPWVNLQNSNTVFKLFTGFKL